MSSAIDLRSDISSLRTAHPDMFQKLDNLRNKIDQKNSGMEDPSETNFLWGFELEHPVAQKVADRRHLQGLHQRLEVLTEEIRALDGYERFMLPLVEREMMSLARDGAIVVVNSSSFHSDALIVTSSAIRILRLPDLDFYASKAYMQRINSIFGRTNMESRGRDNKELSRILLWLWDTVVGPVFRELGLEPQQTAIKNLWWIGVGHLSKLPFHAAGKHPSKSKSAINFVNSSYAPTMKALWYARQVAKPEGGANRLRIELISMSNTAGHAPLPNVKDEIRCIYEIAEKRADVETFESPSKGQILRQLHQKYDEDVLRIVHFACHGLSDTENPLESHVLLLEDVNTSSSTSIEPRAAKLSVREVSSMRVQNAYLAYLGACHTANNSVVKLADEGLHVVSSFQLAGFRHVIGNMWKADDESCRLFSREFYGHLLADGGARKGGDGMVEVSEAFHHALKEVRKSAPGDFIGWIPFVHFGV
ncbi:hypothetical protein PT974_07013 [Cladobotryum mycophilum]|uniref:CHAT domain-containing protein n=1 Tax=Cladobotryum mycophilum TaxID=491253 RepID=A0ABR0SN41_9HYPO